MGSVGKFDLGTVRHSCAHVMAAAICELRAGAQFGVGPVTDKGFFYDVACDPPLSEGDLGEIERRMRRIQKSNAAFVRESVGIDDAIKEFARRGQIFKVRLLEMLKERGSTAVSEEVGDTAVFGEGVEEATVYSIGEFMDLCRGPHVDRASQSGHFKLISISGAYWRGDESAEQLQRIHGLCYGSRAELDAETERAEEAKKRDHRVLGKRHGLFRISEEVGAGLVMWLPKGTVIREELEYLAKETESKAGYQRVATPHIADERLYLKSGHLPYYEEDMFSAVRAGERNYRLRPMNCPHHHHIYLSERRSYRDLPLRIAEHGQVYRNEDSGSLSGLLRTRGFCQNDAHIYCARDDSQEEFAAVLAMHAEHYKLFGIDDFHMRLAVQGDGDSAKYVGDKDEWDRAVGVIAGAMEASGLEYEESRGDAAFYGPKVDFVISSSIGNEYAISTSQLDLVAASKFALNYTGADGRQHPVDVIHRAPLGSHERFVAFLIEHYKAEFPFWLAAEQIRIIPVAEAHEEYAEKLLGWVQEVRVHNSTSMLRAWVDSDGGSVGKRVRKAVVDKIPSIWVVGDREARSLTVSVRSLSGRSSTVPYPAAVRAAVSAAEGRHSSEDLIGALKAWHDGGW